MSEETEIEKIWKVLGELRGTIEKIEKQIKYFEKTLDKFETSGQVFYVHTHSPPIKIESPFKHGEYGINDDGSWKFKNE